MTQKDIVTHLINIDEKLYTDCQIYQDIEKAVISRDRELFFNIVNNNKNNKNISKEMKQALKIYNDMKQYISNSFVYEYLNSIVEGINNVIKQIKHTACGYKKFNHLKAIVMLIKGLLNLIIT